MPAALRSARAAVAGRIPHEMLLLDLYAALRALDTLAGATTTDDILNLIFSASASENDGTAARR